MTPRASFLVRLLILLYGVPLMTNFCGAEDSTAKYTHVVSWDYWNGDSYDDLQKVVVYLDGKPIGNPPEAFERLELLTADRHERIRLDLPGDSTDSNVRSVHFISNFLHRWIEKGIAIDLFQNGKKLNGHTVTWTDFYDANHSYKRHWDDFTWIVDGKPIGNGRALAMLVDKWATKPDTVIQLVVPLGWDPKNVLAPSGAYRYIKELKNKKKITVISVQPGYSKER